MAHTDIFPSSLCSWGFFSLPWELRLDIYDRISAINHGITILTPPFHPLYPLLFVCHHMRQDIAAFFYPTEHQAFTFTQPKPCLKFILATKSHDKFLTNLTIHIPPDEPHQLFPILAETAHLKSLSIHLCTPSSSYTRHSTRPNAIYNLPRRTGLSALGKYKIQLRNRSHMSHFFTLEYFGQKDALYPLRPSKAVFPPASFPGLDRFNDIEFHYSWSRSHDSKYFRLIHYLDRFDCLHMPPLNSLRYLAVYGRPTGRERVQFELGILRLFDAMKKTAEHEGREVILGYGCRQSRPELRYFDAWIEGELEVPERDVDWLFPTEDET